MKPLFPLYGVIPALRLFCPLSLGKPAQLVSATGNILKDPIMKYGNFFSRYPAVAPASKACCTDHKSGRQSRLSPPQTRDYLSRADEDTRLPDGFSHCLADVSSDCMSEWAASISPRIGMETFLGKR